MEDFKLLLSTAIDINRSQTQLNTQINKLKTEAIKVGIELDATSAKKAIQNLSKSQEEAFKLSSGKIQLDSSITSYIRNNTKASSEFVEKLKNIRNQIESVDKIGLNKLKQEFKNTTSEIRAMGQTGDSTFTKLGKNVGQFISFLSSATLVMSGVNAIRSMITEVTNLDKAFISLRKVTDETDATYRRFLQTAIENSKVLGGSVSDMVEMTATWAKLGYTINEATELAKTSTIFANVADIKDTDTAVGDLVTSMKAYNIQASDSISIADKFNELGNKYSTDAASLGEGLSNAASSLALAGNDINESLALITGGTEITQNASEMGNAVKVLSMRLRGMKGELEDIGEEFENVIPVSKIQTQIYNLTQGTVNIMDDLDPTKFKSTYEIMKQISDVWSKLSEVDQSQLLEIIAGKQRGNSIAAIIQSFQSGQAQSALQDSINSVGSALKEQQKYMEGIQYSADRLKASFQELASDTINSGWVKGFLDLSNVLVNVVDKVGLLNIAFVSLAGVLGAKTFLGLTGFANSLTKLIIQMGVGATAAETLGMALSTAIPAIAIIGGIAAITKAYDKFNVTLEENQATLSKQKDTYTEASSNVDALGKRIEECQKKLEELNNVNGASLVKDGEQKKLENQTKELQRQLDIEKEKQRIAGLEAEQTATKTLNSDINSKYNYKTTFNEITGGKVVYEKVTRDVELQKTIDDYNKLSDAYQELEKEQQVLANAHKGTSKEFRNNEKDLKSLTKQMEDARKYANDLASGMQTESESLIGATKSGDAVKKVVDNSLSSYGNWLNSINGVNEALDGTQSSTQSAEGAISGYAENVDDSLKKTNDSIDDFQKSMETIKKALSDTSSLSSSELIDLMQQFPDFDWNKYGVTGVKGVGNLTDAFKALALQQYDNIKTNVGARDSFKSLYEDTVDLTKAVDGLSSTINSLDNISNSLNSLDSAYSSLIEKQSVSIGDIKSLSDTFGNIAGFQDFINTISSATSVTEDVQNAFNNLVTSYLNGSDVLSNLDDSTKDLVITQLNHIGVTNAEEIVTERLAQQKSILAETGIDVKNATAQEIIELLNEKNVSEDTRIALLNLANQKIGVNNIALSTSGDIQSLLTLMSIANATNDSLTALAAVRAGKVGAGKPGDMENLIKRAQDEVDAYYKSLIVTQPNVSYGGGTKTQTTLQKKDDKKGTDKTKKDFSQVFDWLSTKIDKLKDKAQTAIDSIAKYTSYKYRNTKIDISVKAKIDEKTSLKSIQDSYNKMADKVGLSKKYRDLVDNGGTGIETITDEKLAKKIEGYKKWKDAASGVGDEIASINKDIKELNQQKLDNISSYFDVQNSYVNSKISRRQSLIDLNKSRGKTTKESDYNYLIKLQNDLINNTKNELDKYSNVFNQQVKDGLIKKGSTEYQEGLSYINKLTSQAREAQSAIYDINTEIREVRWKNFDDGITKISNINSELSDLASLISDESAMDSNGNFTDEGYTKLGLYAEQMQGNNKLVSEYNTAIKALDKELKNGVITQTQYDEELANYKKLQRDALKDNQSLTESIYNLAKARVENEIDAISKQTEETKKLVDAQKDALSSEKELHDYQKSISKQTSSIDILQKQIEILRLSTDRKDIAQRLKLEQELKDKQADLEEAQYQHSVDVQQKSYDEGYDSYEKSQKEKSDALKDSLKDQDTIVKNALDEVFQHTSEIGNGIETLANEHGIIITDSIVSPWQSATSALQLYKEALETLPTSTTNINTGKIAGGNSGLDFSGIGAGIGIGLGSNTSKGQTSKQTSSSSSSSKSITSKTSGLVSSISADIKYGQSGTNVKNLQTALKGLGYNIGSSGIDGKFGDDTLAALKKFQKDNGISIDGIVGSDTKKKFKLKGYKSGISKILKNQLAWTQENGNEIIVKPSENALLTPLASGDGVIKPDLTKNLMEWGKFNPTNLINTNTSLPDLNSISNRNAINVHYDTLLNVEGNIDKSVDVQSMIDKALEKNQFNLLKIIKQNK